MLRANSRWASVDPHERRYPLRDEPLEEASPMSEAREGFSMREVRAVTTLRRSGKKIAEPSSAYEEKLSQAKAELVHVSAAITINSEGASPHPYVDVSRLFGYRELYQLAKLALETQSGGRNRLMNLLLCRSCNSARRGRGRASPGRYRRLWRRRGLWRRWRLRRLLLNALETKRKLSRAGAYNRACRVRFRSGAELRRPWSRGIRSSAARNRRDNSHL